jgi:hypothetical protein
MLCFSTGLTLLVDLFVPNFVNILLIKLSCRCIILIGGIAVLVDLLVFVLWNTFVMGLLNILFGSACCLVVTRLETLVLAGLSAVKCLHIGLVLACVISFI